MKYLLIVILSFNAYALEKTCEPKLPEAIQDLLAVEREIDWHAASDEDVRRAPCLRKNIFSDSEMTAWLKHHQSKEHTSKTINGINFEGETPENLEAFEQLTTAIDIAGRKEPKRQLTFSSQCKKVDCAVKEIFGQDVGIPLLFMKQKFGMNGSHLARGDSSAWKKEELDTIMLSLSDFPDKIFPIKESKTLVHYNRADPRMEGEKTIANAVIEVFDLWDGKTPETKRSDLTHELGHSIAAITGVDRSPEWMQLSGWSKGTIIQDGMKFEGSKTEKPETVVSKYGMKNELEDLAESVVAYRYNPKLLKELSPEKYDLIKSVIFDDVEYTSEATCRNPKRRSLTAIQDIEAKELSRELSSLELKKIADTCAATAILQLSQSTNFKADSRALNDCFVKAIQTHYKTRAELSLTSGLGGKFVKPLLRNAPPPKIPRDKLAGLVEGARRSHSTGLMAEVRKGMKSYFTTKDSDCGPETGKFFYQEISEDSAGFSPYEQKDAFKKIATNVCDEIKKKKVLRSGQGLDYTVNEMKLDVDAMFGIP